MVSIKMLITLTILVVVGVGIKVVLIDIPLYEEKMFPDMIGDMILKNNYTGVYFVRNITIYDNFKGDIIQGYKAVYSNNNGTMIIFLAQVQDNITANKSLKDMVVTAGFNESTYNESEVPIIYVNNTIVKLPVKNPEVFAMQKSWNQTLHYIFYKKDKVYWIGFNDDNDTEYQVGMLVEIYKNVDKKKGDFGNIDV